MLHEKIAREIPQIARGQVWCRQCGSTQRTDSAEAMRTGWPKCCGYTMTIDSPEEQKWLAAAVPNEKGSGCPTDFIPAGAKIIIGVDMADDDCTVKGFYDPAGEYHIQEVVHNEPAKGRAESASERPEGVMLNDLLERYWNASHAEGKEGRDHDTEDGVAQQTLSAIQAEVRRLILAEREACAKVCDDADKSTHPADLADRIRRRSNNQGEPGATKDD